MMLLLLMLLSDENGKTRKHREGRESSFAYYPFSTATQQQAASAECK